MSMAMVCGPCGPNTVKSRLRKPLRAMRMFATSTPNTTAKVAVPSSRRVFSVRRKTCS
jgi:hypothetical protein